MLDDVIKKKPILQSIRENGDGLTKANPQDKNLKTSIDDKIEKNQDIHDKFSTKVEIRYNRLQNALLKSQEFQTTFTDFNNTLDDIKSRLDKQEPLDVRYEPLKNVKEEHEVSLNFQKQPSEVFCKFRKIHRKTLVPESLF